MGSKSKTQPDASPTQRVYQVDGRAHYMTSQPQAFQVFGFFPVPDEQTARLTKIVMSLSLMCGLMMLISAVLFFLGYSWWWGVVVLLMAILLPSAGVTGAKEKNESLLLCFAGCNMVFVIFLTSTWIFLLITTITLSQKFPPTGCKDSEYFWVNMTRYSCHKVMTISIIQLCIIFVEAIVYGFCFYYAYKLAKKIEPRMIVTHSAPPVAYSQQPPYTYPPTATAVQSQAPPVAYGRFEGGFPSVGGFPQEQASAPYVMGDGGSTRGDGGSTRVEERKTEGGLHSPV